MFCLLVSTDDPEANIQHALLVDGRGIRTRGRGSGRGHDGSEAKNTEQGNADCEKNIFFIFLTFYNRWIS